VSTQARGVLNRQFQVTQPKASFAQVVCPHCGSASVRSFQSIYLQYSSKSVTWKGLLLPHGYSVMRRRSLQAELCEPPFRPTFWGPASLGLVYAAGRYLGETFLALPIGRLTILAGAVAILWLVSAFLYLLIWYPNRMRHWKRCYMCNRCANVVELRVDQMDLPRPLSR